MNKIVFATNNLNKIAEVDRQLGDKYELISLEELEFFEDLEETQDTLDGNAWQKARFIAKRFNIDCFADDTGLEIEALNGEPGVHSARYAGDARSDDDNMDLVLKKLEGVKNRNARFRTVIALVLNGKEYTFEGEVKGIITLEKSGENGFGYDPIFQPDGFNKTFSEFSLEEKNEISHRGQAVAKLVSFLSDHWQ